MNKSYIILAVLAATSCATIEENYERIRDAQIRVENINETLDQEGIIPSTSPEIRNRAYINKLKQYVTKEYSEVISKKLKNKCDIVRPNDKNCWHHVSEFSNYVSKHFIINRIVYNGFLECSSIEKNNTKEDCYRLAYRNSMERLVELY